MTQHLKQEKHFIFIFKEKLFIFYEKKNMNERLFLFFVHDKIKLFYFYFGIRTAFKPDQNGTCFYFIFLIYY